MKQCTGCGKYNNEALGLNKNGKPYLACCPDNNYVEVEHMTPKEKAEELFDKFRVKVHDRDGTSAMNGFEAKQCALIAVDEILQSLGHKKLSDSPYTTLEARQYYVQVKQEIENL
jgi:hypothetical protein